MLIIISILISICAGLLIYIYKLRKKDIEIIEINKENQLINSTIEQDIKVKNDMLKDVSSRVETQSNILKSLTISINDLQQKAEERAEMSYEKRKSELETQYSQEENRLKVELHEKLAILQKQLQEEEFKLQSLEAKQLAYIQARQRQEEIDQQKDYYRLKLDEIDINDIKLLRELQVRFSKKESIDKLIWEVYYKPAYDILMSHLFKTPNKVCGIYQIVDLTTGQGYIGQSVDIKERFRQHIKSALTYGKTTNRLYQAMQKSEVYNFTFEILEEVSRDQLNEREIYWINFYKTKEYGMNSTRGGA